MGDAEISVTLKMLLMMFKGMITVLMLTIVRTAEGDGEGDGDA